MIRRTRHITQRPEYFRLNPNHELSQGLVFAGLGRFPGGYRYDDTTESLWGGGHPGALVVGAGDSAAGKWAMENGRTGASFDGVNDYIGFSLPDISMPLPVSVSCWFQVSALRPAYSLIRRPLSGGGKRGLLEISTATGNPLTHNWDNNEFGLATGLNISANEWHFACAVIRTNGVYLRLDSDIYQDSANNSNNTIGGAWQIFANTDDSRYLGGKAADVAIWCNHALTDAEISILANPADPMLDGWIVPPGRAVFPATVATTNRLRRLLLTGAY
jgi:hypothetical protein